MFTFHRPAAGAALIAGEPVAGPYFERFWLPVIGPTAFVTMRHLATALGNQAPYVIDGDELAGILGIGHDVLDRTIGRLVDMHLLRPGTGNEWTVRLKVTMLEDKQVRRLPRGLARQHRDMTAALARSG